jgi:hypothetical protein
MKTVVDAMPAGAIYDARSGDIHFLGGQTTGAIYFSSLQGTLVNPTGVLPPTVRVETSSLPRTLTLFSTGDPFPSPLHVGRILQDGSANLLWGVITPIGDGASGSQRVLFIPEPSGLSLIAIGTLLLALGRRNITAAPARAASWELQPALNLTQPTSQLRRSRNQLLHVASPSRLVHQRVAALAMRREVGGEPAVDGSLGTEKAQHSRLPLKNLLSVGRTARARSLIAWSTPILAKLAAAV